MHANYLFKKEYLSSLNDNGENVKWRNDKIRSFRRKNAYQTVRRMNKFNIFTQENSTQ